MPASAPLGYKYSAASLLRGSAAYQCLSFSSIAMPTPPPARSGNVLGDGFGSSNVSAVPATSSLASRSPVASNIMPLGDANDTPFTRVCGPQTPARHDTFHIAPSPDFASTSLKYTVPFFLSVRKPP